MKTSKLQKGLVLVTITAGVFAVGCELIVDFDRTKIPVETTEASAADANVPEGSTVLPGDSGAGDADAEPTSDADAESPDDAGDAGDAADQ
jgi:hypothetical protein